MECNSIPDITFIKFEVVFSQQGTQFVLKTHLGMVPCLFTNIFGHCSEIRLAHGEIGVATLPFEVGEVGSTLF